MKLAAAVNAWVCFPDRRLWLVTRRDDRPGHHTDGYHQQVAKIVTESGRVVAISCLTALCNATMRSTPPVITAREDERLVADALAAALEGIISSPNAQREKVVRAHAAVLLSHMCFPPPTKVQALRAGVMPVLCQARCGQAVTRLTHAVTGGETRPSPLTLLRCIAPVCVIIRWRRTRCLPGPFGTARWLPPGTSAT